jgi:hypothetical protein
LAVRPLFIPKLTGQILVEEKDLEFDWYPGFSVSQKQKSIESLHAEANKQSISPILEVSTKSKDPIGASYSAFRLQVEHSMLGYIPLECAFQGSKVFSQGGPFEDLYEVKPIEAKKDPRLKESGPLEGFQYEGDFWELVPQSAFYDFLYLNSLRNGPSLLANLQRYSAFSDIEFNPKKSINCQARSCALAVSLISRSDFESTISKKKLFLHYLSEHRYGRGKPSEKAQGTLPLGF